MSVIQPSKDLAQVEFDSNAARTIAGEYLGLSMNKGAVDKPTIPHSWLKRTAMGGPAGLVQGDPAWVARQGPCRGTLAAISTCAESGRRPSAAAS